MTIAECAENAQSMRMVRLKSQERRRAEVLTSYGEALEKAGGGERARSADGGTVGRVIVVVF